VERTQIYLTNEERKALRVIARRLETTQSEVIRIAIDRFLASQPADDRTELLRSGRGLWKDRTDLPDLETLRRELDRTGDAPGES
jgi:Ribbon-helix-helix protein, copG family